MKYTVNRKSWARGRKGGASDLLNEANRKCCLGFVGKQCGIPTSALRGEGSPAKVDGITLQKKWPAWLLNGDNRNSNDCVIAMQTNDTSDFTDKVREAKLKKLFAKHGDRIVFVN